jgi:catechol 2,3-dioxygenase
MSTKSAQDGKIRARFSHMGLVVKDIEMMENFYTNIIGFERTDGGMTGAGVVMIFMTLDPEEHHQIFLVEGRPDDMPTNTIVPGAGGAIHHLAFRLESLADLRTMYQRISAVSDRKIMTASHGVCWTMYTTDPEGNGIEFFADSPWYVTQPFLKPMDFNIEEEELMGITEKMCREAPGFMPIGEFYEDLNKRVPAREKENA